MPTEILPPPAPERRRTRWWIPLTIIGALIGLVIVVGLIALGGGYPQYVRDNFVAGCTEGGGVTTGQCTCILDQIEAKVSLPEFMAAEREYTETKQMPPSFQAVMEQAAQACV